MSKERLEEIIKQYSAHFNVTGRSIGKSQFRENLNWLIQQAERVQELEKDKKAIIKTANIIDDRNQKLEQQNKRYREALESILNNDQMYITNEEIILKALEESE